MPNYYEILGLPPMSSSAEIEAACDMLYNRWRLLVNHPERDIVTRANEAMHEVEAIRTTLADPAKRTAYDAGLGLTGTVGGLADPESLLQRAAVVPPAQNQATSRASQGTPAPSVSLWRCPNCSAENPPQTEFCFQCGTRLLRRCPECGKVASLVATGFCGKCGYPYVAAQRRVELKAEIEVGSKQIEGSRASIDAFRVRLDDWPTPGTMGLAIIALCLLVVGGSLFFSGDEPGLTLLAISVVTGVATVLKYRADVSKRNMNLAVLESQRQALMRSEAALEQSKAEYESLALRDESERIDV